MVPNGWDIKSLEDIAKVTSGGTPSKKHDEYWEDGNIPWIRTTEVQNCIINPEDTEVFITRLGLEKSSAKLFPKGTVLLAMIGQGKTRGQVALLNFEASTNQNCAAIIFNQEQHPAYYFNFLQSQYKNIRGYSNSAGQSNLSGGLVKSLKVPVPPLAEQKKIAKILTTWDKAITTTEKLIKASKQQKKALMQQLLTGKKRFAGFQGEWQTKSLYECLSGSSRRNKNLLMNHGDLRSVTKAHGMVPMKDQVKGESVERCKVVRNNWFAYNPMRLNVGSICRWTESEDCLVSPDYVVFSCNEDLLLTDYFNHFRSSHSWNDFMVRAGNGSVRVRIYLKDLAPLKITLPPVEEQWKIASVLTAASKEIESFETKLTHLKQEKKALMQQLLTGKRRVKVKAQEAA
ncbi:MAG: restriction endonuclease subunit S [Endozoicomonas sp.]|uniref:restriction endonuclease subunit S n=1 Tax=Endozoicomonas sp. TaxID=1892382 RepID=UPI003D9B90F8